MSEVASPGVGTDFWPVLLDSAPDASPIVSQSGGDALISAPPSLSEGSVDDDQGEFTQAGSTPSGEGETANHDSAVGVGVAGLDVLASLSTDAAVAIAPAADIADSMPADGGVAQVFGVTEYVAWDSEFDAAVAAMLAGSDVVDAGPDEGSPAAAESDAPVAPAAALAVIDGAGFDGAMGASLVYDDCWCEPTDGSVEGEWIDYGDGSVDGWFTKPYIIGDVIEEVPYDDTLPVEGEDGYPVDEEGDWTYVDDGDEWVYVDDGEDWSYVDEGDDWVYVDEGEDWTYVDEGDEWVYTDDGEDWTYVDEGDDWAYVDESGEWIYVGDAEDWTYVDDFEDGTWVDESNDWGYVDEGGDLIYVAGDTDVVDCWGYPEWSSEVGTDELLSGDNDTAVVDGGTISMDYAILIVTTQLTTSDGDLFIVG